MDIRFQGIWIPALTPNPLAIAAEFIISPQGAVTTQLLSPAVSITPEPGSLWLVGGVLALLGGWSLRRRRFSMVEKEWRYARRRGLCVYP